MFLYTVCHVVVVVVDSMDHQDPIFKSATFSSLPPFSPSTPLLFLVPLSLLPSYPLALLTTLPSFTSIHHYVMLYVVYRFLRTVEQMKVACIPHDMDSSPG